MQAVVLVGGFGTRLRPLTLAKPKQLLPIVHMTMLERVVTRLGACGVDHVVLSLGYRPDQFIDAFPDGTCGGVTMTYAQEPEPLDTAGAIGFAARFAGISDTFIAVNGDVLTDLDVAHLWSTHRATGAEATIALTPVEDPSRFGVVVTHESGRVERFLEKPPPGTAPSNWINAGTYVLEPSVLDLIEPGRPTSIEREVFPALASRGSLYALGSEAYWIDAGTPTAYLEAQLDVLAGRRDTGLEAGVSPQAIVDSTAQVVNSVVEPGAHIGADAVVENSVIMPGVVVGSGAVIRDSIVAWNARVESGVELVDLTVVGESQLVPSGTTASGQLIPGAETWT